MPPFTSRDLSNGCSRPLRKLRGAAIYGVSIFVAASIPRQLIFPPSFETFQSDECPRKLKRAQEIGEIEPIKSVIGHGPRIRDDVVEVCGDVEARIVGLR